LKSFDPGVTALRAGDRTPGHSKASSARCIQEARFMVRDTVLQSVTRQSMTRASIQTSQQAPCYSRLHRKARQHSWRHEVEQPLHAAPSHSLRLSRQISVSPILADCSSASSAANVRRNMR
jgi:hypothetical protein